MIKMIIAPPGVWDLGCGHVHHGRFAHRRAYRHAGAGWFMGASLISLTLGLLIANLTQPGSSMSIPLPEAGTATQLKTRSAEPARFHHPGVSEEHRESMANNAILQILVFSRSSAWHWGILPAQPGCAHAGRHAGRGGPCDAQGHRLRDALCTCGRVRRSGRCHHHPGLGCWVFWQVHAQRFYLALAALWLVLVFAGWLWCWAAMCFACSSSSARPC